MIEELKKELESLESKNFMLDMKDHWSKEDYELSRKFNNQIKELSEKIKALETDNSVVI